MFDRQRYEPKRLILGSLRAMVRGFDPALVSRADAVALLDWASEVERLAAALKTLAAGRAADGDAWRDDGARSAADWLATRTGSTVGEARAALNTAAKLPDAPGTDAALRNGELSPKQAEAIAPAAAADPAAEARLLELARCQSLQKLREECARVRAAADPDPAATHARIHRNRFWKRWTDPDGARRGSYAMTPENAALFEAAAQPFIDARIDHARRDGDHEPSEAYAVDGLLAMGLSTMHRDSDDDAVAGASGDGGSGPSGDGGAPGDGGEPCAPPPRPRPPRGGRGRRRLRDRRELIAIVNLESLLRGSLNPGEVCEIAGVGPIPLDVARSMFGDALLRIVIRDGVGVRTVVHAGRTASAVQETAVLVEQGGRCGAPRCDLPISEIDHRIGFPAGGAVALDGLLGLCGHHHDLKSLFGHTYRPEADGSITWIRPDGVEEPERPPPRAA